MKFINYIKYISTPTLIKYHNSRIYKVTSSLNNVYILILHKN